MCFGSTSRYEQYAVAAKFLFLLLSLQNFPGLQPQKLYSSLQSARLGQSVQSLSADRVVGRQEGRDGHECTPATLKLWHPQGIPSTVTYIYFVKATVTQTVCPE